MAFQDIAGLFRYWIHSIEKLKINFHKNPGFGFFNTIFLLFKSLRLLKSLSLYYLIFSVTIAITTLKIVTIQNRTAILLS